MKKHCFDFFKKQGFLVLAAFLFLGFATSCSDNKKEDTPPTAKSVSFPAKFYGDNEWKYFSFAKGDFITVDQANYKNDQNWDLGFQRYYVRTNSGTSGNGKGGAVDAGVTSLEAVTTIPSGTFITDEEQSIIMSDKMPPVYSKSNVNKAFSLTIEGKTTLGWATFAYNDGMVWKYNKNVFVVRTADGNYAKVLMKSYLDKEGDSGTVTFEYIYPFK